MKLHDWRPRLQAHLLECAHMTFRYGEWDCAIFVGTAAEVQTGADYVGRWIGRYSDLRSGLKTLRHRGYRDHVDLVRQSFSEVPVAMAQEGDIALFHNDALGIVQGSHAYVLGREGLGLVSMSKASTAFRVE